MYSGRYVSSRDTPQPPYLLIQQNRCQTLNTHAQQYRCQTLNTHAQQNRCQTLNTHAQQNRCQTLNTHAQQNRCQTLNTHAQQEYSSPINEQMRSMTSNNQGANSQFFQRMVLQNQNIYSTFPKPSRSTISNHPSGFRTISQRRLLHHKQMLESNCNESSNMFVNQFELNYNTPAARGGIYNDNIQPGLTVAEFEQLTQQNINENSCGGTCNNALYRHVMNERMKSTGNNQLSDRSINPDNISPLLSLGEFERLTQQNINENVPAQTCNNTLLYRSVMNERMKSVVTNQLSDRSINTRTRTMDIINNNLNHNYANVSSLDDHTYSHQNPENLSCKDENRFLPAFCTNCQNTSSYQPFGIPEKQSCLLGTTQDLKSSKSCTCISKPKNRKKRKKKSAEDPSLLQSALKDVTNNETAVNEDKKAKIHPLCDRSINTRTDNIKPLLTLGEFERLRQQNINENVPAQTCNNTLLYRSVMNERMKSVVTNQLSDRSINTRTRTMDIINNNLNHNYANVSSLDDHTYSHQNPENLSCKDENRFLPAFCTNCQNTSSCQPFGIPEKQSCLLGTTQDLKSSKSCTCISKPKKWKKKSAEDPNLLQSALKDVTNNETAVNEDKKAKIHPPKQQTVKPFFQSSCVNGQDTVVTCSEQNAKLDYLALQQCQKDTNSFQCSTAKTKMNLPDPCSEKSSCNNEANAIVQNESLLLDSKNVDCKSSLKKMQIVNSEHPPKSQNCNCENQKESANILDQHNGEEQTGSLCKEKSSERFKFAHMLVNILKIMLNGRKKKTNKIKNKWSENLKTDPKCSSDNNISMENGTTIQDRGHSAQLSKSTENFSMSTLYKENINDELNDSTERTKVEEGKIKSHSHQTRIEQTTVSSNLKSNDGNILQCVFESKNNLKLYGQDGNQDSEDTNQFVTKQRENECIIDIDHTFVKKFEKTEPAEVEHKNKDYVVNNLKPLDFDLDLQCIDKGDNYRKEIDAMRMNMNNQKVNSLNNNVNSEEQANSEKVNSLNNNVNSMEQENNVKVNSLNNDVNSVEQENNEKLNSLNSNVNSMEQENNEKENSLNNNVNSMEQENNEKENSLNNNVNSMEQENNEKENSLNNNVNSEEQEKINSLNNNVNSMEQENDERVNSLNNVNSEEQENNEKVNSLNNNVNSMEQENNEKENSLNNNVNSMEQENNEKENSLNNNVNSEEQEKINSLNNNVNSMEQENDEKVNSLNNVNSEEQENNEKVNSLNNNVNSEEQETNVKLNSLNSNVNSVEPENNEKVNSLNIDVNSDEQENNEKINSLNNNVNSEEQENNEKVNSLNNNVNSEEQETNVKLNSLNSNVNSVEPENNEKVNSLNIDVNSDEQENNEKINSLNNNVNSEEQENNEKVNSLNNNVNSGEQENNEKVNSLNNNVNSEEQENNEIVNSLNNNVNSEEQENNEKVNSLNNNVNSMEQENNVKVNSLNNNVNSDEQENNDIRWDQECDTCRTPYSQLSAKDKTTGNNDFSFLELGYCPIVLPLGCHEYEEDVNNNDLLETSVNDEDSVFRNTLMVKLCDEKYNHDKTEVLRPWIIQYLDEIPKPTVWKDFLENMDVENGAILDECDEHVFVDVIASPDVDEENCQTEVTCLWNEKIESLSNTPPENVNVSPKSQMDKDTNLYKTRKTSENLLLQETTSVKKMNSCSLSKGKLEKKENYVGPTEIANDNVSTGKSTGVVNVNILPSECTENNDDLFIQNDTTENYDHEETGRHIDNNLMKIKTTKQVNENDLNLPKVENKQIEKVRTNERKRGKNQSTDCKLIEEAMQLDGHEVRQSDENHLPKMMTSLHEVETNGQAARKSDISQKESEALTGLLILRNGHVCDSRKDMSNRNGYDFYCVGDISGIHGNTCDSRNDKSIWSKQEWPRIDDMSDENRNNYDSRNCSVIEISEDKTFETQTTYTCTISDINLSNTQTTCSFEKEIDVNFSATQFSEYVFDEPIRSTQKEPEMGIFSLNKGDQELNSNTQTINVDGERNDSNTLYTASMSNRTISRANNTDTENVCPIKPPFPSMEIDVAEPILFNDITLLQNKNKRGQKRDFEDVEKHIQNMLQEVRKKCHFDNLFKNQQQNASSVMAHVTVRENPVTNTSFVQTPLIKENSVTNTSFVQTPMVEENPVTNASFVQTPMVDENSVTNASFVQTPLVEENSKSDGVIQDQNTTSCLSAEDDDDDDDTTPTVEKPRQAENTSGKWLIPILERFNIEILKDTVFVTKLPEKLYSRHQDTRRLNAVSETNYVDAYTGKQNIADNAVVQDCRNVVSVVNSDIISSAVKKLRKRMRLKLSPSTRESNKKNESSNPRSYISAPITRSKAAQMSKQSNKSPIGEKKSDSCSSSKVKFISNKKKRLLRRKQKFGKEENEPKEKICNTNNEHEIDDGDHTNLDKSKTLKMTKSKAKTKNDTETMATRKTVKRKLVFDKETDEFENDIIKKRLRSMKMTKDANEIVQCKQTAKGKLHSDETDEAKVKIQDNNVMISKLETDSEEQWNPVNTKRKKKINSKTNAEAIIETIPSEQSESNLNKKGKKNTRPRIEKNSKQIMKPAIIETIPSEQSESNLNKKGKKNTRPRIEKNSKQIMKPAIIETIPSEQSESNLNKKGKKNTRPRIEKNSKQIKPAIIETIPSEQSESNLNKKGKKNTRPRIEKNSKQIMKTRTKSGKKKLEPKIKALKKLSELNMAKSKPSNDGKVTFRLVTESAEQKILNLKAETFRKFHAVKTCRYCHMTVPRRKYAYHVKVHHPYTCAKCSLLFSTKEEKLSHRREKHLTEIYHCITCDNVFYMKWCYEKHVTSSRHRNIREMYRRAVDMMRSCLGLSVDTASQGLKMLTDGHNSTTDDSTNSHDAVIHKGHDPEVQKLLKDLSGIKSHMLSCNATNVSFPMIDMEKNQSAFYNYNTVSELMSQNYASIYTSDNTQFNDLNLDALVVNSDNFPMITQNSLNSSSENCQFMSCINSVAMETYSSSSSTLDLDESCFRECFENSDHQSELNMVDFSQTAAEYNNSPTKGLISEVFHLLETDGFFDCGQFKSLDVERNVDLSNIDISKEFGQNKQSTDLWKDLSNGQKNVCNESTVNYSLLDISQKATTSDINTFPQDGNRYFNFDNMQGQPNISSRLALSNINLVSENCCAQNLVLENCHAQNLVSEICCAQNLVSENCCSQNLVSENCCSQNLVSENCFAQNLVAENCHAQNLVAENCCAQNIVPENCPAQNIVSENYRSRNLVSENCLAQSIASDTKDSESTHLQYHNVTQMENRLVVEAEFNAILHDIAETETGCL